MKSGLLSVVARRYQAPYGGRSVPELGVNAEPRSITSAEAGILA